MSPNDFVDVQLTKLGAVLAGNGVFQVHEGQHSFYFKAGEPQRVTRAFDWNKVLGQIHHNGHPIFEIVYSKRYEEEHAQELDGPGVHATPEKNGIALDIDTTEVGN